MKRGAGRRRAIGFAIGLAVAGAAWSSRAVILDATADPAVNTNAPGGALADSGWAYEGQFSSFLGTAVAPHFFLTAHHIGGDTNTAFVMEGTNFFPDASYDDAASDLRLWHVPTRLPRYAPTYVGTHEAGRPLIVIGRGTRRGDSVVTEGLTNGWLWGSDDGVQRWGSNSVTRIVTLGGVAYLYATFDHGAGPDECHISRGDSGGGAFVLTGGRWQLAGIHYSVDGQFSHTNSGGFDAALVDMKGLYVGSGTDWTLVSDHVPSGFYSTRVAARYTWITNVIPDFDSDADGLPDRWEQAYAGSLQGMVATNDADSDGADNLAEWEAQTDPTNAASRFTVGSIQITNGMVQLVFEGHASRYYRVYTQSTPAASAPWAPADPAAFTGLDGPTGWTDTNHPAAALRFYRLGVGLEPF